MKNNDKNYLKLDIEQKDVSTSVLPRFGGKIGVFKKSIRPTRSLKPLSLLPRKFNSISKVQRKVDLQEKSSESI